MVAIVPDADLLKHEAVLASVLEQMRAAQESSSVCETALLDSPPEIQEFLRELKELQASDQGLNSKQLEIRTKSLQARMIALALGLKGEVPPTDSVEPVRISRLVSFSLFEKFVIVLPEDVSGPHEEQELLHDLELLFEKTGTRVKWVIDCSGLKTFSGLLFGNLIFYQDRLRQANKGLYLHWLSESILEQRQMDVLVKVLNLVKIGGQFFSSDQFE